MQTLWSRVAQAKSSCRCRSCIHTAATIARRATNATSKRRVRAGDIFTACYSTILATATFADARKKEDRRKEWDRIIAEAKAGVLGENADASQTSESQARPELEKSDGRFLIGDVATCESGLSSGLNNKLKSFRDRLAGNYVATIPAYSKPLVHKGTQFDADDVLSWPGMKTLKDKAFIPRDPTQQVHLNRMADGTRNLVARLLSNTVLFTHEDELRTPFSADLERQRKELAAKIKEMRDSWRMSPTYVWEDIKTGYEMRTSLHRSLNCLFSKVGPDDAEVDIIISKVCYNLLITSAPPNIGTYNILIREFTRLRRFDLSDIAIDSWLNETKLRPNRRTVKLVLDNYVAAQDPAGLRAMNRRMRGLDGSMVIKRIHMARMDRPETKDWAQRNKVIRRGEWIYQKVERDAEIFDTLIRGTLIVNHLKTAIRYIRAALREGVVVYADTIVSVVEACMHFSDNKASRSLLEALLSIWESGHWGKLMDFTPNLRFALHRLLSICGYDSSSDTQSCPSLLPAISQPALRNMLRFMHLQSIEDSLSIISDRILCMELTLSPHRDKETSTAEEAWILLQQSLEVDRLQAAIRVRCIQHARWIKLDSMRRMIAKTTFKISVLGRDTKIREHLFDQLSTKATKHFLGKTGGGFAKQSMSQAKEVAFLSKLLEQDKIWGRLPAAAVTQMKAQQARKALAAKIASDTNREREAVAHSESLTNPYLKKGCSTQQNSTLELEDGELWELLPKRLEAPVAAIESNTQEVKGWVAPYAEVPAIQVPVPKLQHAAA